MSILSRKPAPPEKLTPQNPFSYEPGSGRGGDAGRFRALVYDPASVGEFAMELVYEVRAENPLGWRSTGTRKVLGTVDIAPVTLNKKQFEIELGKPEKYTLVKMSGHVTAAGAMPMSGLKLVSGSGQIEDPSSVLRRNGLVKYDEPVVGEYKGTVAPVVTAASLNQLGQYDRDCGIADKTDSFSLPSTQSEKAEKRGAKLYQATKATRAMSGLSGDLNYGGGSAQRR